MRIDRGDRRDLTDLANPDSRLGGYAEEYAEKGRAAADPMSADAADYLGGKPGQFSSVRLLILPVHHDRLFRCLTSPDPEVSDPIREAIVVGWRHRWQATPYAIARGGIWIHVPSAPKGASEIAAAAMELIHVNNGLHDASGYFTEAASPYWFVKFP